MPQRPFFSYFSVDLKPAYSDKLKEYVRTFCFLSLGGEQTPTTLAGPLCTSLDRVGTGDLPTDLQPGDVVVFGQTGAYAYTQAMTHFLSHPVPEQHWVG